MPDTVFFYVPIVRKAYFQETKTTCFKYDGKTEKTGAVNCSKFEQNFRLARKDACKMQTSNIGMPGYLDRIRLEYGNKMFPEKFSRIAKKSGSAAEIINAGVKMFATLYLLIPAIDSLNLYAGLNRKLSLAVSICADIIPDMELSNAALLENYNEETRKVLRWIFISGTRDDGLDDVFDAVIDCAASVLVRHYHEKSVPVYAVPLIFHRNRRGRFIHDLVWATAGLQDPGVLLQIARYLDSSREADRKLAGSLLSVKNTVRSNLWRDYKHFSSWYRENRPYLYFTGEGFNQTSEPTLCGVNVNAKYLCRPSAQAEGSAKSKAFEDALPEEFLNAKNSRKNMLADYSQRLHQSDRSAWEKWRQLSVENQAEIAEKRSAQRRG